MPSVTDVSKTAEPAQNENRDISSTITWSAPEYHYYEKTADWYWALGIIAAALLVVAYISGNILFGFIVVIGGFAFGVFAARAPRMIEVTISGQGVQINNRLFPYETLQSFWIFYRPGDIKEVSFRSQKIVMTHIKVPLGNQDPNTVRKLLLEFLPEKPQKELLIDTITRVLRF